jgi:hypothetical protein
METSFIRYVSLLNLNVPLSIINSIDDFDTVYIAHCYPYTYTKLQMFLRDI